jgi:ribosomal protein L11 methylase PrmA
MSLKDCSAYNIQFENGKPIFIDTTSFEKYTEGKPWIAYKQFCQHFLAPLTLISYKDIRLSQLLRIYLDGIPLDLVSSILPLKTKLSFSLLTHIHLHSKAQKKYEKKQGNEKNNRRVSLNGLIGIIDNLESTIRNLSWEPKDTEWSDYYDETNYTEDALKHKRNIISDFLNKIPDIKMVWDFGANTGEFSRLASEKGIKTIAFDIDPSAVEKNYLRVVEDKETNLLPLELNVCNPSPGIGWENMERKSLINRGPSDVILALALIHHLAISNNIPLQKIAFLLSNLCKYLIIEFIPKDDSKVQFLLSCREDIFTNYTKRNFESEFSKYFSILDTKPVLDSKRTIYLMKSNNP